MVVPKFSSVLIIEVCGLKERSLFQRVWIAGPLPLDLRGAMPVKSLPAKLNKYLYGAHSFVTLHMQLASGTIF
jgi:hypothetical protein